MSRKSWTAGEIALLREVYDTARTRDFLHLFPNRSYRSVEVKICRLKLTKTPHAKRPWMTQLPIGSQVVDSLGYVKVKLGDDHWKHKHKIVWEQYYGRKPRGVIKFLDSDRTNCNIENLMEMSREECMRQNSMNNLPEELREVIHVKGRLTRLINVRRKKNEQHAGIEEESLRYDERFEGK